MADGQGQGTLFPPSREASPTLSLAPSVFWFLKMDGDSGRASPVATCSQARLYSTDLFSCKSPSLFAHLHSCSKRPEHPWRGGLAVCETLGTESCPSASPRHTKQLSQQGWGFRLGAQEGPRLVSKGFSEEVMSRGARRQGEGVFQARGQARSLQHRVPREVKG